MHNVHNEIIKRWSVVTTFKGERSFRRAGVDYEELSPQRSQQLVYRSPDGFNGGYGGSGPAQLTLALLPLFVSKRTRFVSTRILNGSILLHFLKETSNLIRSRSKP